MKIIGNIIWLFLGGIEVAFSYFIGGLILMITIIGIPFGIQCFKLGMLSLWPFGSTTVKSATNNGCLSLFMNVLWFFCGGVWIMLEHLFFGVILCITIIGIPFGMQHFKLMAVALTPFGREIVEK